MSSAPDVSRTATPGAGRSRRSGLRVLWWALIVLPWTWFLLRDALGVVGDVVAVGMPVLAVAAAGLAGLCALRRLAALVPAVSVAALVAVAVLVPWLPADAGAVERGRGMRVLSGNVGGELEPALALRVLAAEVHADVVVMPEPSASSVAEVGADFPHRFTALGDNPKIAVFSRFPLRVLEGPGPDLPGVRLAVAAPGGEVALYALHVPRPWFRGSTTEDYQATVPEHFRQIEQVVARVAAETGPVVVAGDLNSTDRGRDYRTLVSTGGLVDAMRDTAGGPTSIGRWEPLFARIDHVLVGAGWCGDNAGRPVLPGSEHRAVAVTVGPCAGSGGAGEGPERGHAVADDPGTP